MNSFAIAVMRQAFAVTIGILLLLPMFPGFGRIERVVEAGDAKALNGFPDAAFIVGLKPGFRTGGGLKGEVATRGKSGGTHG